MTCKVDTTDASEALRVIPTVLHDRQIGGAPDVEFGNHIPCQAPL
jgi:hypothetical protein